MLYCVLCPVRTQVRVPAILIEVGDCNLGLILSSNSMDKVYFNSTSTDTEGIEFLACKAVLVGVRPVDVEDTSQSVKRLPMSHE